MAASRALLAYAFECFAYALDCSFNGIFSRDFKPEASGDGVDFGRVHGHTASIDRLDQAASRFVFRWKPVAGRQKSS